MDQRGRSETSVSPSKEDVNMFEVVDEREVPHGCVMAEPRVPVKREEGIEVWILGLLDS